MTDEAIMDAFTEGFAKVAEAAGLRGGQVRELMELSLDLAQRAGHPEQFDAGFSSALRGS